MASIIPKRAGRPKPWLVQWREPGTKKQKWQAFKTKGEAEDFRDTVSTDLRRGTYQSLKPIPFKTWAEDWLERRRPIVSPNTAVQYEWAVGRLNAAFGMMPIQNLRAEQIETWQAKLLQDGKIGRRSVQIIRTTLGMILADARKKGYLYANPMEMVERFEVPKRELQYLNAEDIRNLCHEVGLMYGTLFLTMAFCGLRIGEALGLQWPDVDFDRARLFIRRQVIWRRAKDCRSGESTWIFAEPKSEAGARVVELPSGLLQILLAYREEQNGSPNPHALVFCTSQGTPLEDGNVRRRHFKPALARLGLPEVRMHDFRRTFIALHVEAGTHPKLVQTRAGHSDIRLTMDTYGKMAGEMALQPEQMDRLDGLVAKALPEFGKQE